MNSVALTYALLAGVSMATYVIALRMAAPGTHPALGTAIITGIAFLINVGVALSIQASGASLDFSKKSLYFLGRLARCATPWTTTGSPGGKRSEDVVRWK